MNLLADSILALLVLISVSLQKTYSALPIKEVKRRARSGDKMAKLLFKAASYGHSLRTVLWIFLIAFSTLFFLNIARTAPTWFALSAIVTLLWIAYVWIPSTKVSKFSARLAGWLAPPLAFLLSYLHPLIDLVYRFIRRHRPIRIHTGLYDKEDLIRLIDQQAIQIDNRIDKNALEVARSALTFGDKLVRDFLTPKRIVKSVKADEAIGPVLMTELHDSGHSRFPVYEGKQDNIIGTLYQHDLVRNKSTGTARSVMKKNVSFVHEEQSLFDALQAILKTRQHMLVVVNSFEEYVGIITMEDVIEQIIGKPILDEFDEYGDLRAVAARAALIEHKEHIEAKPTTSETSEVIE